MWVIALWTTGMLSMYSKYTLREERAQCVKTQEEGEAMMQWTRKNKRKYGLRGRRALAGVSQQIECWPVN